MIQVGAGSEGEDGDGQSQTFLYKHSNFLGTYYKRPFKVYLPKNVIRS